MKIRIFGQIAGNVKKENYKKSPFTSILFQKQILNDDLCTKTQNYNR